MRKHRTSLVFLTGRQVKLAIASLEIAIKFMESQNPTALANGPTHNFYQRNIEKYRAFVATLNAQQTSSDEVSVEVNLSDSWNHISGRMQNVLHILLMGGDKARELVSDFRTMGIDRLTVDECAELNDIACQFDPLSRPKEAVV